VSNNPSGVRRLAVYAQYPGRTSEFEREAGSLCTAWGEDYGVVRVPTTATPAERAGIVLDALSRTSRLDHIAFFCHGWPHKVQVGFALLNTLCRGCRDVGELGGAIASAAEHTEQPLDVVLYACSCGRPVGMSASAWMADDQTAGSFAAALYGWVSSSGARVTSHGTAGHTTRNPRIVQHGSSGAVTSVSLTAERGMSWYGQRGGDRAWRRWLSVGDNRWRVGTQDLRATTEEVLIDA